MRKNVIVVGMPRSGTSMAASIFAGKGYFVAKEPESELRPGDEFNPAGYWEANSLIEANVEVFNAAGYPQHNTWMFEPITEQQAARITDIERMPRHRDLVESYNANSPWLWKDPRLCYTLGYWWPLLDPSATAVLWLTRDADHVFQSFLRVGWRKDAAERGEVAERVRAHMVAAERAIKQFKIPHIKLDYQEFADRPEETARTLSDLCGVEIRAADLGFDGILNHSSVKGGLVARLERIALWLPASWRAFIKKCMPGSLLRKLFPGRWKQ